MNPTAHQRPHQIPSTFPSYQPSLIPTNEQLRNYALSTRRFYVLHNDPDVEFRGFLSPDVSSAFPDEQGKPTLRWYVDDPYVGHTPVSTDELRTVRPYSQRSAPSEPATLYLFYYAPDGRKWYYVVPTIFQHVWNDEATRKEMLS